MSKQDSWLQLKEPLKIKILEHVVSASFKWNNKIFTSESVDHTKKEENQKKV
jgi:hypothetical protein